jgi:hypothetical protein
MPKKNFCDFAFLCPFAGNYLPVSFSNTKYTAGQKVEFFKVSGCLFKITSSSVYGNLAQSDGRSL